MLAKILHACGNPSSERQVLSTRGVYLKQPCPLPQRGRRYAPFEDGHEIFNVAIAAESLAEPTRPSRRHYPVTPMRSGSICSTSCTPGRQGELASER